MQVVSLSCISLASEWNALCLLLVVGRENSYRRTGFNCVVKSLRFRILNTYCVFNNCVIAYTYCVTHIAF